MTPQAEELTTGLWHEGLTPLGKMTPAYVRIIISLRTIEHVIFANRQQIADVRSSLATTRDVTTASVHFYVIIFICRIEDKNQC